MDKALSETAWEMETLLTESSTDLNHARLLLEHLDVKVLVDLEPSAERVALANALAMGALALLRPTIERIDRVGATAGALSYPGA